MKARSKRSRGHERFPDDIRRPVWLEATESFYRKLNRIAKRCEMSRYDALSKGLDALLRELEIQNSALNRNIKSPAQSEVFRRTMGQVSRNYWATVHTHDGAATTSRDRSVQIAGDPTAILKHRRYTGHDYQFPRTRYRKHCRKRQPASFPNHLHKASGNKAKPVLTCETNHTSRFF